MMRSESGWRRSALPHSPSEIAWMKHSGRIVASLGRGSLVLGLLASLFGCGSHEATRTVVISVNQFVEHPNLDALLDGFREEVDTWATDHGVSVEYKLQNANGSVATALQIAQQQAAENPALILALATPSAQAALKATATVPILFGAITDPVAAGLVASLDVPGGNATGSSDIGPYADQFRLIRELRPQAKNVGIIRNPGEANSVASMLLIDRALQDSGFTKVEVAVSNTSEVPLAASSLVGRADVLYMPADNTVLSALAGVAKVADANKIPLFVGDEGSVKLGAVATLGIDYRELGKATGRAARQVLDGTSPGKIPVQTVGGSRWVINKEAAERQGVSFPESMLKTAVFVSG